MSRSRSPVRIGELSRLSGVSQRMLRYYEEQGLLPAQRAANGYRVYAPDQIERARTVASLIAAGLPTRLIKIVLEMEHDPEGAWTQQCSRDFSAVLADELVSIEERITCLQASRDTVRHFLQRTDAHGS